MRIDATPSPISWSRPHPRGASAASDTTKPAVSATDTTASDAPTESAPTQSKAKAHGVVRKIGTGHYSAAVEAKLAARFGVTIAQQPDEPIAEAPADPEIESPTLTPTDDVDVDAGAKEVDPDVSSEPVPDADGVQSGDDATVPETVANGDTITVRSDGFSSFLLGLRVDLTA